MENIQQQVIQNYQENLNYFKEKHSVLYKKLETLENAINLGNYQEKYALEYKNEGYFDVQDISTNAWLYGQNSEFYSTQMVQKTTLKREGGIFSAQRAVDLSIEIPDVIDKSDLSFNNGLWSTIKIIEYNKKLISKNTLMQSVFKTIFIGTGLGLHITPTINKLNSKVSFIMEKDLELFRLSLFVTNYAKLAKNVELFFSIFEEGINEQKNFIDFLEMANNQNLYIKHIPFFEQYEPILSRLQSYVFSQIHILYGYSPMLFKYIESPKYIAKGYSFINVARRYNNSFISKKPILFIFSGPSSGKYIEWVKQNKDRFVIVTALSTCRLLYKHDIKPDIVMHIDPGEKESQRLFEGIEASYFDNIIAIFGSTNDEKTVSRFKKENVFFIDQDGVFKKDFGNLSAPSVGEYTYALFLVFDCQSIYMLGLDLALDNETLSTHDESHPFAEQGVFSKEKDATFNTHTTVEYVKGNFLEKVPSVTMLKISINEFSRFTDMLKQPYQNIYNLSNGAYLNGAIPTQVQSIDTSNLPILEKNKLHNNLIDFLNKISSNEFRQIDKKVIKKEIMEAKKLIQLIKKHENSSFNSAYQYLEAISTLSWNLSDMQNKTNSCLAQVYYEYFKIILSYICDIFNTPENLNEQNKLQEIDKVLVKQLNKMGNVFVNTLEGYLKY